ncbi:Bacterial transcriptional regulator [Mycobacteroides abscessus subsp. abscessus]|nr:Bacterial transcriptional regulator [Mycobacteroides abscessus subsp. abscessus]
MRRRELVTDFIYAADCDRGLRVGSRAGVQLPAHATAGGKALLALLGAVGVAIDHPAEVQAAAVVIAAPASRVSGGDVEYLAHELESTAASIAQAWQDMNPIAFSRG